MANRKRIVRHDPTKKTIILEAEREADLLFGKARGQVRGFSDFIRSQGVVGLAVGIIIGTSLTTLVKAMVDGILDPLIGIVLPSKNLSTATVAVGTATLGWGSFVSALLDFILIAIVVYVLYKTLRLDKLAKESDNSKK